MSLFKLWNNIALEPVKRFLMNTAEYFIDYFCGNSLVLLALLALGVFLIWKSSDKITISILYFAFLIFFYIAINCICYSL